jgi:GTP pyrophosphokinase
MRNRRITEFISRIEGAFAGPQASIVLKALALGTKHGYAPTEENLQIFELVAAQNADHVVVASLLLAPLRRGGMLSYDTIRSQLGEEIADLVESVYAQELMRTDTEAHRREDLRDLLESFSHDLRSSVLQVATRFVQLEQAPAEEIVPLAQETMDVYVPLAGRLGMGAMRARLEDVCFSVLEPEAYGALKKAVLSIRKEDDACLELLIDGTGKLLERNGIHANIHGRTKGLYSLARKMKQWGLTLEAITDKIGLRIIVSSVPECYAVLGLLHTHYRPIPNRFKDYIGLPKDNGYQSLHTCVYPVREISHKQVEFQIRTEAMHMEAEFGVAAHWLYKNRGDAADENQRQLTWVRGLTREHEGSIDHGAFLERLEEMVYRNEIVVFGDKGERVRLPVGATVSDFLRGLGLSVDRDAIVKVNGAPASLITPLKDGDTVTRTDDT